MEIAWAEILSIIVGAIVAAIAVEIRRSWTATSEEAKSDPALKSRLEKSVNAAWRGKAGLVLAAAVAVGACGCRTRTVYVPDGTPVRIAEPIKGAAVEVLDQSGNAVKSTMTIPAGWYALRDPGPDKTEE